MLENYLVDWIGGFCLVKCFCEVFLCVGGEMEEGSVVSVFCEITDASLLIEIPTQSSVLVRWPALEFWS